ncbi:hypothetical protein HBI55_194190 [Parastagonospora nodorum]|nr:hypothetical protein HBI55_194190 [Parastagonospora nodorum]
MHASLRKELEVRHSLLNLSIYNLVEKFARHSVYAVFKYLASSSNLSITIRYINFSSLSQSSSCNYLLYNTCKLSDLYKAGISLVIDTLIVMPIKDNDNLLNTINLHIKLRKLKEKYLKVCEADALKQVDANIREEENKNYSSLYYSNSNSDTATKKIKIKASQLRKASEEEELAKTKKEKREKELDSLLDSNNYCLDSSLDINSKDNLENKKATIAKDLARKQKKRLKALLNAKIRDSLSIRVEIAIEHCTLEE